MRNFETNTPLQTADSLELRPLASHVNICHMQITTAEYSIFCISDGEEWMSYGESALLSSRPPASLLGKGQWQVGESVYLSDGSKWAVSSDSIGLSAIFEPDRLVIAKTNPFISTGNLSFERVVRAGGLL